MTAPRYDTRGPDVLALQRALLARRPGSLPRYGADGHLGAETWGALAYLAAEHGIAMVPVDVARAGRVPVPPEVLALLGSKPALAGVQRGLLVGDDVIAGTEWVRRDPAAWWHAKERGTRARPRGTVIDQLVGHWTGGEATTRSYDDDGPHVVRAMKARTRADGTPLQVGIHVVIGASEDDPDKEPGVWQTMDLGLAAIHVGKRRVIDRSIGVEVVSAGMPGPADVRHRPRVRVPLVGQVREVLRFTPGQLRAWVRLAETLAALDGRGGIRIPRRIPPTLAARRFTPTESRAYAGALEHLHVPNTRKLDAGGLLIGELDRAGWARG